jgi:diguanylate cyclase (GGDEF)-like protein
MGRKKCYKHRSFAWKSLIGDGMKSGNDTLELTQDAPRARSKPLVKASPNERMSALGIPAKDMTQPVTLAVSALLEKLDDLTHELSRTKENLAEIERLVDVDRVAPVPNRRAFMRRLAWAMAMKERYGHPCSILYFDLNDFKQINDTYGHAAGDMAIRHVSKIFLESLRGSDFMARLSGDEFAVLMYYAEIDDARERGRKIADRIAQSSFMWGKKPLSVTAAYGAYEVGKEDDPETALSNADTAMYLDKKRIKSSAQSVSA